MLVKSVQSENHLNHLRKTFATRRWYNIKLHPEKCEFKVASGKFIDFLISNRVIKVNLDQIKDIEGIPDMLTSKKEVQG